MTAGVWRIAHKTFNVYIVMILAGSMKVAYDINVIRPAAAIQLEQMNEMMPVND